MYRSCIIYVFSGTGNTMRVAEKYAEALKMETRIVEITASYANLPLPDDFSLVGIGYPVHAFNAPQIVHRFAKHLSCNEKKNLFIFHTGGEGLPFNDSSSAELRIILRKHFTILSERHYVMPYNMIFRHSDAMVRHMVTYMERLVRLHAVSLMTSTAEKHIPMPLRHLISILFRIEWIYAVCQARMMKAGSSCTGCGLCARMCPMGNITMKDGKPVFSSSCSLCVRCSFSCPMNAISIGLLDGWKVNGKYQFERIMQDSSLRDTIPIKELPFIYRGYYRRCEKMLNQS